MNKKKIKSINAFLLHRAIVAGIRKVVAHQDYLNKINVFPVPDGDTGTNMCFTLLPIASQKIFNLSIKLIFNPIIFIVNNSGTDSV